ncbi:acetyltransferase [Candidatus Dojkabacteria bacterium]|uniref:Acetyltransferase n=1 Tax=Candidatus Dojkabacteria bacterium TaxID=2099670 RepID=A0A5C7J6E9_9BACT|nr:MAG: acetyltransferase [Candidatus Dojkabacteria bacterium]
MKILYARGIVPHISVIGAGGFAREVLSYLSEHAHVKAYVSDEFFERGKTITFSNMYECTTISILPLSELDPDYEDVVVAIGDPKSRQKIVQEHPEFNYATLIANYNFYTYGINNVIGRGTIICPGTIVTTNVSIGNHVHLNLQTTVGHDTVLGDFVTTAPGAKISGNCNIGKRVYIGTNASIKEKIDICDDAVIGLNAGVVKSITEAGTYVGTPVKKIA